MPASVPHPPHLARARSRPASKLGGKPSVRHGRKTFVLDTNVLIHDPGAIFHFEHSRVVVPLTVIEELDAFKRLNDDRGHSVRQVMRWLNRLRERGKLSQGIPLEEGAELQIDNPYLDASSNGLSNLVDRFKGQPLFGTVRFDKTVRSTLAALANELL